MNTGNKKYQVFISSTFEDLKEERKQVAEVLLNLDCFPAGMELFPGVNDDIWTVIERVIDECDYFLLIIGGKYGSGYTEREYDYAASKGIPIMAFVHQSPEEIAVKKSESAEDQQKKLDAFRIKVGKKITKKWNSTEALGRDVGTTFQHMLRNYPRPGWIRANEGEDVQSLSSKVTSLERELAERNHSKADDYLLKVKKAENMPLLAISGTSNAESGWIFDYKNVKGNCAHLTAIAEVINPDRYSNGFKIGIALDKKYIEHNQTLRTIATLNAQLSPEAKQEIEFWLIFSMTDSGGIIYTQRFHCRGHSILDSEMPNEIISPLYIPSEGPEGILEVRKLVQELDKEMLIKKRNQRNESV